MKLAPILSPGGFEVGASAARTHALAYEAYPSWGATHPEARCPADLHELNEWMNNKDIRDPWGGDYRWDCQYDGTGVAGVLVSSAGPDRRFGTADDIRSDK